MSDPTDEIVWEEPPTSRTKNPIVLKFRGRLEANPGKSARVQAIPLEDGDDGAAEKAASATAQAFTRLEGFTASYKKILGNGAPEPLGEYRVWAQYDMPAAAPPPPDEGVEPPRRPIRDNPQA